MTQILSMCSVYVTIEAPLLRGLPNFVHNHDVDSDKKVFKKGLLIL